MAERRRFFRFEPAASFADAIIQQVAGLITEHGWEVRGWRVDLKNDAGRIVLPLVYDDGSGQECIAYIQTGFWDPVAREDIEIWMTVLRASPRRDAFVTVWGDRDPPPFVLELIEPPRPA
ncbi:MAG TPA: hypothetical protein VG389_17760 [Myxococcota bacterium]|nr:hypothetical protein [Myxococcota bacterium]